MRFYTPTKLSEHIAETREGFLVCYDVPIARTGEMLYAADQVPVEPGEDGLVRIERDEAEVFAPEAVASYEGKPTTVDHPAEDVTPETWKGLACGHAQGLRRGEGEASDLLLADLVITDEAAIKLVRGGLREVSCGYDADYEQTAPGRGRQRNIRGNHIALVQRGRCGSRCRINDNSEDEMNSKKKTNSVLDALVGFLRKPEVRKALDEDTDQPTPPAEPETPASDEGEDRLAALEARINELEIQLRNLAAPKDEEPETTDEDQPAEPDVPDEKPKARDAALARTVDAETKQRAMILVPGMSVRDSDKICAVQRSALRAASAKDESVAKAVTGALRGATLDGCDCVTLDAAFLVATEVAKVRNNQATADGLTKTSVRDFGKAVTPADINRANEAFYKKGA